jgi:cytochrome b6-f complex iron-sulfur subunit
MAGVGGLVATGLGGLYASLESLVPGVNYGPSLKMELGSPEDLAGQGMRDFQVAGRKISLIMGAGGLYALVRNCTHMGCIPAYAEEDGLFHCPCHGSIFKKNGDVVRGPAPEPLYRAALIINLKGLVEVDGSILENDERRRDESPFVIRV